MRIAFFSPLSPAPSGIADYSEALLPHLAAGADRLDVFVEDFEAASRTARPGVCVRHYTEFETDYETGCFDAVLYHIGNNPFHVYIYDMALRIPGVLVLHEFNLHHLLAAVTIVRNDWEGYIRELEYNAGPAALARVQPMREGREQPDYDNIPMNRRLLERSQGAIVHSDYMVGLLRQGGYRLPVRKILHGVEIPATDRAAARGRLPELAGLALEDAAPLLGIFGFLKPYKRIRQSLRAFARLHLGNPAARLILVGEEHPHYPLRPLIAELGIEEAVRILGYVPLETLITCMAACDLCINLRGPTAGETSGSFLRALALGKPVLVSEIGSFLELPEDIAVKIPLDEAEDDREDDREVAWLFEYMRILTQDTALAHAIGERARAYAAEQCNWPRAASLYVQFLEEVIACGPAALAERQTESAAAAAGNGAASPSSEELENYVMSFSHDSPLMEDYGKLHLKRLARTLEITPPGGAGDRVLEMGCYLQMTPALRKYLGYGEVRGAYYGPLGRTDYRATTASDGEMFTCPVDLFDAERDSYPYPDGHFHTVLCCELLEHLSSDPMHMMAEINRILAPGGHLVLSTPNIASLRSVHAVVHGYHPALFPAYIKPAANGTADPRHSREYAPREIAALCEAAGFHVALLETGDYGNPNPVAEWAGKLLASQGASPELRGEVIYCVGRKIGPVRERWPQDLYYST